MRLIVTSQQMADCETAPSLFKLLDRQSHQLNVPQKAGHTRS